MKTKPIAAAVLVLAALISTPTTAETTPKTMREADSLQAPKGTCGDLVGEGWAHMPDVSGYVLSRPGAVKLGFGSPCNIDSLVFSQCWLEPRLSVKQAIDLLLAKARAGKKLPDVPMCGP